MPTNMIRRAALLCIAVLAHPVCADDTQWMTAAPADVQLDARPLEELADQIKGDDAMNLHSVLIVKDGKLVFERYFSGSDADWGTDLGHVDFNAQTLHDLRSASKSVTSALVGVAVGEGKIPDVDATVFDLFPGHHDQLAPDKRRLTFRHILTMTAGLDWFQTSDYTNPGNDELRMEASPDPVAFVLGRSFAADPGARFEYNSGLTTLLGALLEQAYGKRGDEILKEKLLDPLGIQDFYFHANDSGLFAYASGMRLRPRDMARIGQLYLQKGEWNGRQLIPETWVTQSLSMQIEGAGWTTGYGYQWWINRLAIDGETWDVPIAAGNGNQEIILVEPLNLVMVVTGGHYNASEGVPWGHDLLLRYVLPAAGKQTMRWVTASD